MYPSDIDGISLGCVRIGKLFSIDLLEFVNDISINKKTMKKKTLSHKYDNSMDTWYYTCIATFFCSKPNEKCSEIWYTTNYFFYGMIFIKSDIDEFLY